MASKRHLSSSQSSTSAAKPARPSKRTKLSPPPSSSLPEPSTLLSQLPNSQSHPHSSSTKSTAAPALAPLPPAKKRTLTPGTLRRLSSGHPNLSRPASGPNNPGGTRANHTLSGQKIGGKAKDLKDTADREEIWVKRPKGGTRQGLGFAGYLKKGVGAFVDRGCTSLSVNGMGAAIPLALSLALAIRDAIPGGQPTPPTADGTNPAQQDEIVRMEVRTGSKVVKDEVTPDDDDEDMVYQSRTKSTVEIELRLNGQLASSLGNGNKGARERGGTSGRGRKRRGGKR
ncbi:hypothetical protein JCM11641_004174 [Rhodosporidiobolus odoratus]